MSHRSEWTTEDFDAMSWHDCHVHGFKLEEREADAHASFQWRLPVNWPKGLITFESPGFTQVLRRAPILIDRQWLLPRERRA